MKLSADEVCLKKGGTAATTRPFSQGAGFLFSEKGIERFGLHKRRMHDGREA